MASISYDASKLLNKVTSSGNAYISNYSKRVREADTDVQDFQKQVATFRKNVRSLRNYDSDSYNREQVKRQITSFVKSYNDLKSAADKTDHASIKDQMNKLEDALSGQEKNLKKLGVKFSKEKLKFDTDTFDDVTDKETKKLFQTLFEGSDSFISQVYKIGRNIEKAANTEEYQMNLRNFHTTTRYTDDEIQTATNANQLKSNVINCANLTGRTDSEADSERATALTEYVNTYNQLLSQITDSGIVSQLQSLQNDNAEQLEKIGITVNADNSLSLGNIDNQDAAFCEKYDELFGNNSDYVTKMKQYCDTTIGTVLKADKLGITLDVSV